MLQRLIPFLIGSALFVGTAAADESGFAYISINHPEAIVTEAQGINAEGSIVGLYVDKSRAVHGYVLRHNVFTTVDYPGAALTYLTGINSNGDLVGVYSMPNEIPGLTFGPAPVSAPVNIHGFVLKRDGTFIPLPPYPGHPNMIAQRILPDGSVLGCFHDHDFGFWMRGFVWKDGIYTGLDGSEDGLDVPSSMNNGATPGTGKIAGLFMDMELNKTRSYVIQKGSLTPFDYPGASVVSTRAWDINPSGAITGDYRDATGAHGFALENGSFTSLTFPAAPVTEARGINPGGAIVGWYTDAKASTYGFLAIPVPRHGQ